jgi:cell division topological specificity factor
MASMFERLIGRKTKSANTAKERLQLVLVHDRVNLPPGIMDDLRDELIAVISQHVEVDRAAVRIDVTREGREQRLIADIPLLTSQRRQRG